MDFGISEILNTSLSRFKQLEFGGSLPYMSPEQVRGRDVGRE
jgi:serine/threonine protein kinase